MFRVVLFAGAAMSCLILGAPGAALAQEEAVSAVDEVIVTGTREAAQTQFTALSPVDVLSKSAIQSGATNQLAESLAQLIPSFDVKRLPTSDGLQFIRPASLNNLSPDMTLVLVNGKRFHRSAFIGVNGSQAADLAQIPNYAIGHVEVLRDGASAQYGADAIAGGINIILDTKPGLSAYAQASKRYLGDGAGYQVGVRGGTALGGDGHLVATVEYSHGDPTSRSNQRPDAIAFQAANPTLTIPNPVQRWGDPELTATRFAFDAAKPLGGGIEAYGFGTYVKSDGLNDINWRNPATNTSVYKITPVFPGFDLNKIYPTGFTPREGIRATDYQVVGGVRRGGSERFTWDLSASYGENSSRFFLNNSINASLGPNSPTSFNLGRLTQTEFNLNADAVYRLSLSPLPEPINIAFGAERRLETYQIETGDPASYAVGPGAAAGLAPQSNGFPGYNPQQAGKWDQESFAGYVDAQTNLTAKWSVDLALRTEHFDQFGDTTNGKIAMRYAVTPQIAVRAAYSTGFRAPTPGQLFSTSTSQGLDTVTLQVFTNGRLSPLNPVAAFLGAKPLRPETSETLTGGLVWRTDFGFTGSVDLYQVDVAKRFSVSSTVVVTPQIRAALIAQGIAGGGDFTQVNFYTNDFDTRTRGIDLVGGYVRTLGPGRLNLTASYSYNETEVTNGSLTTNPTQRRLFEEGIPQHNASASATYTMGKLTLLGRARYYGSWTDSTGVTGGEIFQQFGGVTYFDASATYAVSDRVSVRLGAENLFDTYPDKATFQASRGLVYSRNSPYDVNGGQYYVRIDARF